MHHNNMWTLDSGHSVVDVLKNKSTCKFYENFRAYE